MEKKKERKRFLQNINRQKSTEKIRKEKRQREREKRGGQRVGGVVPLDRAVGTRLTGQPRLGRD